MKSFANIKSNINKGLTKVRQMAEEKFKSGEKNSELTAEMQEAEERVGSTKSAFEHFLKMMEHYLTGGTKLDREKRLKKLPITRLANTMHEDAANVGDECLLGSVLSIIANAETLLSEITADFETDVDAKVIQKMNEIMKRDIKEVLDARKKLAQAKSELESAKKKYVNATEPEKVQQTEEEYNIAKDDYEQWFGVTEARLGDFVASEPTYVLPLVEFISAQAVFHATAGEFLKEIVTSLRQQCESASSPVVFGRPLVDHLESTGRQVPIIVEDCINAISKSGVEAEGIFRLSGNATRIKKLRGAYNTEKPKVDLSAEEYVNDIHAVSGVLKLYFRQLPDPLLTNALYPQWVAAGNQPRDERLPAVKALVEQLPPAHYTTLRHLMRFLAVIASNSDVNKMRPSNLAIVFGPTLLWSPDDDPNSLMASGAQSSVVECLVQNCDAIFGVDSSSGPAVPPKVAKKAPPPPASSDDAPTASKRKAPPPPAERPVHTATAATPAPAPAPAAVVSQDAPPPVARRPPPLPSQPPAHPSTKESSVSPATSDAPHFARSDSSEGATDGGAALAAPPRPNRTARPATVVIDPTKMQPQLIDIGAPPAAAGSAPPPVQPRPRPPPISAAAVSAAAAAAAPAPGSPIDTSVPASLSAPLEPLHLGGAALPSKQGPPRPRPPPPVVKSGSKADLL